MSRLLLRLFHSWPCLPPWQATAIVANARPCGYTNSHGLNGCPLHPLNGCPSCPLPPQWLPLHTPLPFTQGVPVNELHACGYTSIGCEPCTRPVLPNQHEREGRWWWEDSTAKECGLHSGNISQARGVGVG